MQQETDEIDLLELFAVIWAGKLTIVIFSVIAVFCASVFLHIADRKYSVSMIFKPVLDEPSGANLSGLGGLAGLAGISIPSATGSDIAVFQELFSSDEVAQVVFANTDLMSRLFKGEWDSENGMFTEPKRSTSSKLRSKLKVLLTGTNNVYAEPNPTRLRQFLVDSVTQSIDKNTGFVSFSAQTSSPELIVELVSEAISTTDAFIKNRFIISSEATLAFYTQKLNTARSREHREALAKLMASEEQKLMLASAGSNYVIDAVKLPEISAYPTSPKPGLVLALAFVLGVFSGVGTILIFSAIRKHRTFLNA
ncbi:MAG: Wzz/FepE/Etk N-terminal domain-containing protein [Paracoccaceae bacterium]